MATTAADDRFDELTKRITVQVIRFAVNLYHDGIGVSANEKGGLCWITHLERDKVEGGKFKENNARKLVD